jgi:UDP-N-acetylmuramoyl-tripeptide--D-alanyl-D-alanine ligase
MHLEQLAQLGEGQIIRGDPRTPIRRISTDTRTIAAGDCFLALVGERFDGHDFVTEAVRLGASAAVVSNPTRAINSQTPPLFGVIQVQDTLTALHKLATNYRRQCPPETRVVAVTGSCGKTTTKDMIAAVLGERFHVVKTDRNLNNQIGVPLNLLRLEPDHDYGVFELGTNRPGEIKLLADLVRPDIGVITNVGLAHVEHLGDEPGVAREKRALIEALPREGWAVLNADDRWCSDFRRHTAATVLTVGVDNFADVRASNIMINGDIKFQLSRAKHREDVIVRLRTLGRHQIHNALQAAAVGIAVGMDLDQIRCGLEAVKFPAMRMEPVERDGVRYVNDCYNANLASMKAALEVVRDTPVMGRRIAVLGDMLELGDWTEWAHRQIGAQAAECGLAFLITAGKQGRLIAESAIQCGMESHRVVMTRDAVEAGQSVRGLAREGDLVLLKGSRGVGLERILSE